MLSCFLGARLLPGERGVGLQPPVEALVPPADAHVSGDLLVSENGFDRLARSRERRLVGGVGEQQLAVVCDHRIVRHSRLDLADELTAVAADATQVRQQLVKFSAFVSDFQLRRQSPIVVVCACGHRGGRYSGSPHRRAWTASACRTGREAATSEFLE